MDLLVYGTILTLFAVWMTVHVLLCVRLAGVEWWRGIVGLFVFPLAPIWAQSRKIKRLPAVWLALAFLYALALIVGFI
jgi:hypothetical protein